MKYCWPTPKYRNGCAHHAFFEGKKAEETSPSKSTPRTLKEVGQQYPSDFCECLQLFIYKGDITLAYEISPMYRGSPYGTFVLDMTSRLDIESPVVIFPTGDEGRRKAISTSSRAPHHTNNGAQQLTLFNPIP